MRLTIPLLVLVCTLQVGCRRSSNSGGNRGTSGSRGNTHGSGGHRGSGGKPPPIGFPTGSKPGSGSKPGNHIGWNVPPGTSHGTGSKPVHGSKPGTGSKPANIYTPPTTYIVVGQKPPKYTQNVYGWNYNYAPIYAHGSYTPLVHNPFTTRYEGCRTCFAGGTGYFTFNNYRYYSARKYVPPSSGMTCTNKVTEDMKKGLDQNATATISTTSEMAWTCPSNTQCCGWECCKPPNEASGVKDEGTPWALIIIGIVLLCVVIVGCCWCLYCSYQERQAGKYYQEEGDNEDAESSASTVYSPPPVYNVPQAYYPAPGSNPPPVYPAAPASDAYSLATTPDYNPPPVYPSNPTSLNVDTAPYPVYPEAPVGANTCTPYPVYPS